MMRFCFLVLFVIYVACDDSCVTYDFEDGFEDFSYDYRVCVGLSEWTAGDYSFLEIDSPHENSNTFITPGTTMSCVSSFQFEMSAMGSVEVNFYMDPASTGDQLSVLAFQYIDNFNDPTVGAAVVTASSPTFVSGWQTVRFSVSGSASFNGYLTFMGLASAASTLIVDSFRFIPLLTEDELCEVYKDDIIPITTGTTPTEPTTTETIPTESTTTETTPTESTTTETTPTESTITTESTTTETTTDVTTTAEITTETTNILPTTTPALTDNESEEADNDDTETESPITDRYTFWNAFTISMVVLLAITVLAIIYCIFFHIGRTRSSKDDEDEIIDETEIPEFKVPRVNKTNSSKYYGKMNV